MSIFDLVTSVDIVAYWERKTQDRAPYLGEELFPDEKRRGITLKWIKGSSGLPVVLKPSAFDVTAVPRPRIGFDVLSADMPFFKESKYIDEELRQELNMVTESGNQALIDSIINIVFDDETELLEGAAAQRERMRMQALTTGTITMEGNGQVYEYDYQMPEEHKVTVGTSWSNPSADIVGDIQKAIETIENDTGATITRAVCSSKVIGYIRNNTALKKTLAVITNGEGYISDLRIMQYLIDELGIEVVKNNKRYVDEQGATQRYVSEDIFVMFPDGDLGKTCFGTTPEESDLLTNGASNVTITDTGVAVTTMTKEDPVNVETKVTQICLPSFPTADQVYILDVVV